MTDYFTLIAKVRRAMPRNLEVMSLCDELERYLLAQSIENDTTKRSSEIAIALERLRATKRKAQKKWYHKDKERLKRIAEINQIKG